MKKLTALTMLFGEENDSLNDTTSVGSTFSDIDFDGNFETLQGTEYLSNVDYSLNSPLISDEIEEFQKYILGRPYRNQWNLKTWQIRKTAIKDMKIKINKLHNTEHFHKWFGIKNLSCATSTSDFKLLLTSSEKDACDTFPIIESFVKGWLNKDITHIDKSKCSDSICKWGAYFLDFHIITLLLNANDPKEKEELKTIKNVKYLSATDMDSMVFSSSNFGKILITRGFAVFINENIICDRNMVLMCKDTYIARFQTLFAMVNRIDRKFALDEWSDMQKIYFAGDRILSHLGNNAYDAIKLVEPVCSLRVSEIAHTFRPLIPDFPNFKQHVLVSVEEVGRTTPYFVDMLKIINNSENPDFVLTVFGSFRHWGHPFLQYLDGLKSVHEQVHMPKVIDQSYANVLGSDLAYIVLSKKFKETKKWYVDKSLIPNRHPLHDHIQNDTWPTPKQIRDFGDNWNALPLTKCFDVPDMIDPSLIYSDKSHSMDRSEVLKWVRNNPNMPIPSKKVLETFLNQEATNWKEFLQEINDYGLTTED